MKTNELLSAEESVVTYQLKRMKINELDRHVKKILLILGSLEYDEFMSAIIKLVPTLANDSNRFAKVQAYIRSLAVDGDEWNSNTIERLTTLVMVLIAKRFDKILKEQK